MAADPPELIVRSTLIYIVISLAGAALGLALVSSVAWQGDGKGALLVSVFPVLCIGFALSLHRRRRQAQHALRQREL